MQSIIKKNIIYGNSILTTGTSSNWQTSWAQGGGLMIMYDGLVNENNIYSNHCKSIYGFGVGGGIRLLGGTTKILNNNIDLNSSISVNSYGIAGGISCSAANTIIDSDTITNNYVSGALGCRGAAIYFDLDNDTNWAVVKNNYISGNYHTNGSCYGGAIGMYTSSPEIYNNIITNNSADYGGALHAFDNSKPKIINNTITNNTANQEGGALYSEDPTTNSIIINTIMWDNTATVSGNEIDLYNGGNATLRYSDITGGWTGEGNIDANPFFVDTLYNLADSSLCIGAGIDSIEINGVWYYAPLFDFDGDPRPDPSGCKPDIGAQESPLCNPITNIESSYSELPDKFSLEQNYPNPYNPSTKIKYSVPQSSNVVIKVFDILGNEIETLVNDEKPVGNYEVEFDATVLPSGIYFYRLQAGDYVDTKKMILLR